MSLLLFILICLHAYIFSDFDDINYRTYATVSKEVFLSEKGNDSFQDCGTENNPCKTIGKGLELIGKGNEEETLKIVDSADVPYGFLFSNDFKLTLTTASKQGIRRNITFDLNELATKGKFHLTNEKTLNMEHLNINFLIFETKQYFPKDTNEESAVILSKGAHGDLTLRDCSMIINEWIDDYTTFSILRITDGKVLIDEVKFLPDYYYLSEANLLHISENVELSKLNALTIWSMKLEKECALKLPSSFTLEKSEMIGIRRNSDGPALLEACSRAEEKVMITISKCLFDSVKSSESEKGSCFYFEMLHPESILNIFDTVISFGEATKGGGIMIGATKGKVKLENMVFYQCKAIEDGGGLMIYDLTQMAGFECTNVSFEECQAKKSGGVEAIFGEEEIKGDAIIFKNCLFSNNKADIGGKDMTLCCKGKAEENKTPFDEKCFSTTTKNRVCVMKKDGSEMFHDEWLREDSLELNVDAENGVDSAECGKHEKAPCKTLKQAIANSLPGRPFSIFTTEKCNKYDTEPIVIEDHHIEIKGKDNCIISLTTVLDEMKAQKGEGLFNLKKGGYLKLCSAEVKVDTTRKSGRDNGLFVCDGEAKFYIYKDNITSTDSNQALNCVLIECKSGNFEMRESIFAHFSSSCALILAVNSVEIEINDIALDSISTTSETQSVFTILSGCQKIYWSGGKFSNCNSIEHKIGGALYVEIGDSKSRKTLYNLYFTNCSCRSEQTIARKRNFESNEETKGGAMYIKANDEAIGQLFDVFNWMTFTNCSADKGQYIFISLPGGREQIDDDMFKFEMKDIFGKEGIVVLEERKNGETKIIDLLSDEANSLPYCSSVIYVGGDKVSNEKTCGRMEEPCDLISTGNHHGIPGHHFMMLINGRVCVNEPFTESIYGTISSATESFASSNSSFSEEPNRGTIRIGTNMKAGSSDGVFEIINNEFHFKHIDIEYPDAIEGDALDLIYASNNFQMNDVVFRPWYTELTGENVLGGEGKKLPYKLFNFDEGDVTISQLVIYGRNGNITEKCHHSHNLIQNNFNFDKNSEIKSEFGTVDRIVEEDDPLCSWESGLLHLSVAFEATINDSTFTDISDGAIHSDASYLEMNNCSFTNNHPVEENWKKYPSLRRNLRQTGEVSWAYTKLSSLAPGSDGLDGKPFGMLTEAEAGGTALENMDSYFFSPIFKNITLKREEAFNKNEMQNKEERQKEIEAVVQGSYLFPCGLTFEATKKRKGTDMKWSDCPVSEYTNETEMKVKIPPFLFEVDEYTSVVCRLSYPSGIINGEKKHSGNVILIKQKKDDPNENDPNKSIKTHQVAIIVSVSVSVVVVIIIVIAVTVCVMRKKRRHYTTINDSK